MIPSKLSYFPCIFLTLGLSASIAGRGLTAATDRCSVGSVCSIIGYFPVQPAYIR